MGCQAARPASRDEFLIMITLICTKRFYFNANLREFSHLHQGVGSLAGADGFRNVEATAQPIAVSHDYVAEEFQFGFSARTLAQQFFPRIGL